VGYLQGDFNLGYGFNFAKKVNGTLEKILKKLPIQEQLKRK
jgi:hypothetical protein